MCTVNLICTFIQGICLPQNSAQRFSDDAIVHAAVVSEKEIAELIPNEDDPFTKGVQFNATFISSVEVKSQRDNEEVREKVTKAIVANKPSASVVFIVKPNTLCIRNMIDHTREDYLITQIVYCGAHIEFKDKFFFIHRSKHDKSLFARVYQLSDSDTVKLLTLTIAKAFKLSYEGWFLHVEKEAPNESPNATSARLSRAKSVPTGVLDRFNSSPWPSNSKAKKIRRFSFGDKLEIPSGNPAVYKVHTSNSRTGSVHSVSLTVDMDREFRELAQSRSTPSYLPMDLPATELNQFNLHALIKKHFVL